MTGQTYEAHHKDEGKVVRVPVDNGGEPLSAMRGAYSLDSGRGWTRTPRSTSCEFCDAPSCT
jgi:hypothetical protein